MLFSHLVTTIVIAIPSPSPSPTQLNETKLIYTLSSKQAYQDYICVCIILPSPIRIATVTPARLRPRAHMYQAGRWSKYHPSLYIFPPPLSIQCLRNRYSPLAIFRVLKALFAAVITMVVPCYTSTRGYAQHNQKQ